QGCRWAAIPRLLEHSSINSAICKPAATNVSVRYRKLESRHAALLEQCICSPYLNDQLAKQWFCAEQRERQDDPRDGEDDPKCDDGEPYEWRRRSENVHGRSPVQRKLGLPLPPKVSNGWARLGSNQRPNDYESSALTD